MNGAPAIKDIVLLGGGHSHALLIRQWAMKPVAGIRLTLISRDVLTPYSGMLPGYIAGHYSHSDIHIDLTRLCSWSGVRFIEATVIGLKPDERQVVLQGRPDVSYDCLSIDTGSTPDQTVPGSAQYTVPVKPIHLFEAHWQLFRERLETQDRAMHIGVVGSGVGGFELLLALQHAASGFSSDNQFHWILRGEEPLKAQPGRARALALEVCRQRSIQVHQHFDVAEVDAQKLRASDGRKLALDEVFWVTAAAAPLWPGDAGLATDKRGFVATNAYLQSQSHPTVFASGDIGTQLDTPSAKAGVFAVRQAPVLFQNLIRFVQGQRLKTYRPQKHFLSLMALGSREAVASRNGVVVSGKWVWRWKDRIDRAFMNKFHQLPVRKMAVQTLDDVPAPLRVLADLQASDAAMRCGGCGAKIGSGVLQRVLKELTPVQRSDVLVGLSAADDAAVVTTDNKALVQSVDQFRAMLDDPWILGRIAALHALNDLYAMAAQPQSAQVLITLPFALESIQERDLRQLMAGAITELNAVNCAIVGGHTGEGVELMVGFAVNGLVAEEALPSPESLRPGDALILTKPLGTGVMLAANMRSEVAGVDLRSCIDTMLVSNHEAVRLLHEHGCTALSDVTGFGLLGHLQGLLYPAGLGCELDLACLPLLAGARELAEQGVVSSLLASNRQSELQVEHTGIADDPLLNLLSDPQTSGGLLAGIDPSLAESCVAALHNAGYASASIIGYCRAETGIALK